MLEYSQRWLKTNLEKREVSVRMVTRVFHKEVKKTRSSAPAQRAIEAERSGPRHQVQEIIWCWHKANPSNAITVYSEAPHLLQPPKENGRCCFLSIFHQLLDYYPGNNNNSKVRLNRNSEYSQKQIVPVKSYPITFDYAVNILFF